MLRLRLPVALVLALLIVAVPTLVLKQKTYSAPGLDNRSVTISTSRAGVTGATYNFQFDITSNSMLGSLQFQFCANDPLPFQPCTPPTGFDISATTLTSQTGETGFVIDPGISANNVLITRVPVVATLQTVTYSFDSIVNPNNPGSYYVRIISFASDDGSGPSTEEAGLVFAITEDFSVNTFVPPFLLFCVGITVTGNCASVTGNVIDFGILSSASPKFATSQMAGGTNGVGGMSISVIGTTMTSGINTIAAISSPGLSAPGNNQFGINLRNNSNPNVGSNTTGAGTTVPTANYNTVNQFMFSNGDVVANSPLSTDFNVMTVSYVVNVNENQPPGVYTSTLTYVALASF